MRNNSTRGQTPYVIVFAHDHMFKITIVPLGADHMFKIRIRAAIELKKFGQKSFRCPNQQHKKNSGRIFP